jgi:hypothetical protein
MANYALEIEENMGDNKTYIVVTNITSEIKWRVRAKNENEAKENFFNGSIIVENEIDTDVISVNEEIENEQHNKI